MYDRVDEWVAFALTDFDGKPLQSVTKGDLDLSKLGGERGGAGDGSRQRRRTRS